MKPWFIWNGSPDYVIHTSKTRLNGILTAFHMKYNEAHVHAETALKPP